MNPIGWIVGDGSPREVYSTIEEASCHGHSPKPIYGDDARAVLREAFAFGLDLRHKKGCTWASPASNFQKNKPCACGRDALYSRLNAAAFGHESPSATTERP